MIYRNRLIAVLVIAASLVVAASLTATGIAATGVAATRGVCQHGCSARIRLLPEGHVSVWRSPQKFAPTDLLATVLTVHRHELTGEALSYCHAQFYGQGIVVDLSACGDRKVPLRLRASTVDAHAVVLRVTYRRVSAAGG